MKVVISGSRKWPKSKISKIKDRLSKLPDGSTIIQGGAHGVDRWAAKIAEELYLNVIEKPANWREYGRYAGLKRNLEMLDENPDLVICFWDGESRGTRHMIENALVQGIITEIYLSEEE
jgi:uncharacterized phage-like protein YoqJ